MVEASGNTTIDALLLGEQNKSPNITYSLPEGLPVFATAVEMALNKWMEVANISFTQVANGTLTFAYEDLGGTIAVGNGSITSSGGVSGVREGNKITINSALNPENSVSNFGLMPGNGGFTTILHEVGHFLGLSHPQQPGQFGGSGFNAALPDSQANRDFTIMTLSSGAAGKFTSFFSPPHSPMALDIQAVQHIFGVNPNTNVGDTVYRFDFASTTEVNETKWDAGGIDIVDQGADTSDVTIDLREGGDKVTVVGNQHIWFAHGANIENANGGSGFDSIFGNGLANVLRGNAGTDTISGGGGNDDIRGGIGFDSIKGGADEDFINGNTGNDTLSGDKGNDIVRGGQGNDTASGNDGNDIVKGDLGNDAAFGDAGNDTVRGGRDDDVVIGGGGNDSIFGDLGNDTLTGGSGNDIFVFNVNSGVDVITDFVVGQDLIRIFSNVIGSAADAAASFNGNVLDLGNGNSVTVSGITSLTEAEFIIT